MKPGRYKAIVIDKVITENSKGNPQVVVQVEIEVSNEEKKTMNYYGHLTEKSYEHTLKALVACGIQGNSLLDPITKGIEVSVVVDEDVDQEGKPRLKISWINKPMDLGTPIDEQKGRAALKKFEGTLAKMRQQSSTVKNHAPGAALGLNDSEPIPF